MRSYIGRFVYFFATVLALATCVRAEVIIQYFMTEWDEMYRRIPEMAQAGYDGVWLPSPSKSPQAYVSSNLQNIGYALYDRFDLGDIPQRGSLRTQFGTRGSLRNLVDNLHYSDIKVYPDININHNSAFLEYPGMEINDFHVWTNNAQPGGWQLAPRMTSYDPTNRCADTFKQALAGLIDIVTEPDLRFNVGGNSCGVGTPFTAEPAAYLRHPGQYDKYPWYPSGYTNENVRQYLMRWLDWLGFAIDYDGCRIDATKHVVCEFFGSTNEYGKFNHTLQWNFKNRRGYQQTNETQDLFANDIRREDALIFCEAPYWSSGMFNYYREGTNRMRFLDFPLKDNYIGGGEPGDTMPRAFDGNLSAIPSMPLPTNNALSSTEGVTFTQSHDKQAPTKGELALAYLLTHAGLPVVYFSGNNMDPTDGENGKVYPPGKTWVYAGNKFALGDINGRITNLVYIHNQFGRGKEQGWWDGDANYYALERYEDLDNDNVCDFGEALLLVGFNDTNYAVSHANSASYTAFPSNMVLHDYSGNAPDITNPPTGNLTLNVPSVYSNMGWVCYAPYNAQTLTSGDSLRFSPSVNMTWITPGGRFAPDKTNQIVRVTNDTVTIDVFFRQPPGNIATNVMIKWGHGRSDLSANTYHTEKSRNTGGFIQASKVTATNWQLVATITNVPEGLHTVQARIFNTNPVGHAIIYNTFTETIYVDRHGPDITIQTPASGEVVDGEVVAVITNSDRTATNIEVCIDGGAYVPAKEIMKGLWKYSLSGLSAGNHTMTVHTVECDWGSPRAMINQSYATRFFSVDTTGPRILLNYAEGQTNCLPFFRTYITVATNVSAGNVKLYWDGYEMVGLTGGTGVFQHVFDGRCISGGVTDRFSGAFCNGPHFFEAVAVTNNMTNRTTRLVIFNLYGTEITDSDGDGLPDDIELKGFAGGTQPPPTNNAAFPRDNGTGVGTLGWNDMIPNYGETWTNTNPWREDTWCNGVWDGDIDMDGDGFTNLYEVRQGFILSNNIWAFNIYNSGVKPSVNNVTDNDSDGLPYYWEFAYGLSDMNAADASADLDSDGLSNLLEYQQGTHPRNADTDGDLMSDSWEVSYGFSPKDPGNANQDPDGDGLLNWQEYTAGTNPTNGLSSFKVKDIATQSGATEFRIMWDSVSGKVYGIDSRTQPGESSTPIASGIAATPPLNTYTNIPPATNTLYYRIRVRNP